MRRLNRGTILSLFLAFVVIWFGVNEVIHPENWVSFIPEFADIGIDFSYLVIVHGIVLVLSGLAVAFDWNRRVAAGIIFLMILAVVLSFLSDGGLSSIAVRDIGLLGMALALTLKK